MPDDVKGMQYLVTSSGEHYVFLPKLAKVRRILKQLSSFDMAFSPAEVHATSYHDDYRVAEAAPEGMMLAHVKLKLVAKADRSPPCARLEMLVEKRHALLQAAECFDDKGTLIRRELRKGYEQLGSGWLPTTLTYENLTQQVVTTVKRKKLELGLKLDDAVFTRDALAK